MAAPDPDRFVAGADAGLRFGLLAFLLALSLVRFELERHLRRKNGVRASYRDGSGRVFTAGAASDGGGASLLIDKVAKFRDVRAPGRRGC